MATFYMKLTDTKRPAGQPGKNTIQIFRKESLEGTRRSKKLDIPELNKINELSNSGFLPLKDAKKQAQILVRQLQEAERAANQPSSPVFLGNKKLMEQYLEREYAHRQILDPQSIRNDFLRAISALGNHTSLLSSTQTDIQRQINNTLKTDSNKQRRVVNRLNTLLRYANRGFKLQRFKEEFNEPTYVTLEELNVQLAAAQLAPNVRLLIELAFHTGCRFAELFALRKEDLKGKVLTVRGQLDRQGKLRHTKTRKHRKVPVGEGTIELLAKWWGLRKGEREYLYTVKYTRILTKLLGKKFTFHCLRHSYARYLCDLDVPIKHVADSLGNSIAVCEKYYAGWISDDGVVSRIADRLR